MMRTKYVVWLSFVGKYTTPRVFNEECCGIINDAIDCLNDTVRLLMTGQISIAMLRLVLDHTHEMREICAIMQTCDKTLAIPATASDDSPIDVLQTVLKWRETELRQIDKRKKEIQKMLEMMTKINSGRSYKLPMNSG